MNKAYKKPYTITNLRYYESGFISWNIFAETTWVLDKHNPSCKKTTIILPFEPFKKFDINENHIMKIDDTKKCDSQKDNYMILDDNIINPLKKDFKLM